MSAGIRPRRRRALPHARAAILVALLAVQPIAVDGAEPPLPQWGLPDMENYCRKSRPDDVSECISNELIYRGVISSDWAGEPVDVRKHCVDTVGRDDPGSYSELSGCVVNTLRQRFDDALKRR
jgi:hypothetical protein